MGVYKKGKLWYVDCYAGAKRYREMVGPNRREAEAALGKRLGEIGDAGRPPPPPRDGLRFHGDQEVAEDRGGRPTLPRRADGVLERLREGGGRELPVSRSSVHGGLSHD